MQSTAHFLKMQNWGCILLLNDSGLSVLSMDASIRGATRLVGLVAKASRMRRRSFGQTAWLAEYDGAQVGVAIESLVIGDSRHILL